MTNEVGKLYADALFQLCVEQDCLESVYAGIQEYNEIFTKYPQLVKLLSLPTVSASEKIGVLKKIFGGADESMGYHFLCLLTEKNRISHFGAVAEVFNANYNRFHNILEVTVTTGVPLTEDARKKLSAKLAAKSGKTVKLAEKVEPGILGGVIVRYGNTQIDGSLKNRLSEIADKLVKA